MAKRGKSSKEKRQAERDHQKRLELEHKARRRNQLTRDLAHYAELGLLDQQDVWSETATKALWDSQAWRTEPEFAAFKFDIYDSGRAMGQAWAEAKFDVEAYHRLSEDEQDDMTFELNATALAQVLTPEIKRDFFQRLEKFRQRLRTKREAEKLAQAALVQLVLETSAESAEANAEVWAECALVHEAFTDAVEEYARLAEAAEEAFSSAREALGAPQEAAANVAAEVIDADEIIDADGVGKMADVLSQKIALTPGLMDFLARQSDELFDAALLALRNHELKLDLYTPEELRAFTVEFAAALLDAGIDFERDQPDRISESKERRIHENVGDRAGDWLDSLDEERRAALLATARRQLNALVHEEGRTGMYARSLLSLLEDDTEALGDNEVMLTALFAEYDRYMSPPT
jgi:hypothetical protein